jgi:Na+/phosphate symporter
VGLLETKTQESVLDRRHTDSRNENQLDQLRRRLLSMAGLVEDMLANACQAFAEQDATLAARPPGSSSPQ